MEQGASDASPSPFSQEKGAQLANVRHGTEQRGPEIEALVADHVSGSCNGDVKRFARGQRRQVVALLLKRPGSFNGRMDPL